MTRVRRLAAAGLLLVAPVVAGSCRDTPSQNGPSEVNVARDGSPRVADDAGILTAADRKAKRITLDGSRTYDLDENFVSFSTYTPRAAEPFVGRLKQYVLVGVRRGKATWMAGVGAVVPTQPPTAYYVGVLTKIEAGRAIFRDGTVLPIADGVVPAETGGQVNATIDVTAKKVVRFSYSGKQ